MRNTLKTAKDTFNYFYQSTDLRLNKLFFGLVKWKLINILFRTLLVVYQIIIIFAHSKK